MIEAVEKISDSIEKYRIMDGSIQEPAMGVGLNGRMVRILNNTFNYLHLPILFKNETAACNGYVALMNLKLFDNTNNKKYAQRAKKSLDWIIQAQTKQGYWYYNIPGWKIKSQLWMEILLHSHYLKDMFY